MKVRDVMEVGVYTISADALYEDAAAILCTKDVSALPVLNETGDLVGVVSEKDLFRIMFPFYKSFYEHPECYADSEGRENKIDEIRKHRIDTFMSRDVVTITPDEPIMRAGAMMLARHIHLLPVIEAGKLVGIVSRSHIYRNIFRKHLGVDQSV